MIAYEPLWELMKRRGGPVSTNTLETLCRLRDCRIEDVAVYVPEERES